MGAVFQKDIYKPIPDGAELFTKRGKRFARWIGGRGNRSKKQTAEVRETKSGELRIVIQSKYYAKYRDGENIIRTVATGCKDETAARSVLADLERQAERVRSKVITAAEAAIGNNADAPLMHNIDEFIQHLKAKDVTTSHRKTTESRLLRLFRDCEWKKVGDLKRASLERWLASQTERKMSARTRNGYRDSAVSFARWLLSNRRVLVNPFDGIPKLNENADKRRERRALSEDELRRLMHVARLRPLAELGRKAVATNPDEEHRKRSNWKRVELTYDTIDDAANATRQRLANDPQRIAALEAEGDERALIFKTLALTGLRRSELASITVGQIHLSGPTPYIELHAADEKSRRGAELPLRRDLAADLFDWVATKLERLRDESRRRIGPEGAAAVPMKLPPATPLFKIPTSILRRLNRDLKAAGIPKIDERGRTVDIHALRHTFGTFLSSSGTAPRTAQAAMRHSSIDLTMNVYTDPKLLDVAGAIESLPELPLKSSPDHESQKATGTLGDAEPLETDRVKFAPMFAPANGNSSDSATTADQSTSNPAVRNDESQTNVSRAGDKRKRSPSPSDNERHNLEPKRFELSTSCMPCKRSPN